MNWTEAVDIYCERLGPGFWAEPVNALSNLAFIAAALWGLWQARRLQEPNPLVWLLIALAAVIGIGSFLFHTFANGWSALADVAPIWSFVALYVLVAMNRLGGMRPGRIALWIVGTGTAIALFLALREGQPEAQPRGPDPFNGSLQYLPAVIAFAAFAVITQIRRHPLRQRILAAGLTFLASLTFRTLDRDICPGLPLGTHFLWHLLNGLMIALLLDILIRARLTRAPP